MDKTPISRLQEICAHNGLTPEYQLEAIEGKVHAPTFVFCVHVGEVSARAIGQSKKKAKHAVAKKAIELIIKESDYIVENPDLILESLNQEISDTSEKETKDDSFVDNEDENNDSNPVGKLQEICMKKHWRPPQYETISEEGLPHERVFKMKCIIENMGFSETGIGKSKRLAKRKAAHLMIKKLKDEDMADADDVQDKFHDKKDSTVFDDYIESKKSGKVIPAMVKIDNFYYNLNTSQEIDEMIESSIEANEKDMGLKYDKDYLSLLAELSKALDCTFKMLTVPQLSYGGTYQCMIHLIPNEISYSDLPVLTSWGAGEQLEDAKQTAAGNAIKLFSLMRNKKSQQRDIES